MNAKSIFFYLFIVSEFCGVIKCQIPNIYHSPIESICEKFSRLVNCLIMICGAVYMNNKYLFESLLTKFSS